MKPLEFGKRIITESYFNSQLVNRTVTDHVPVKIQTKNQALDEIIKGLDVIANKQTDEVNLRINTDKYGKLRMITKSYTVDE